MNKEERVLKYINSSTELVFAEKYYCEADFYEDVENILKENQELKKQLEIKHNGFMASVEEACELAEENQKLKEDISFCLKSIKQEMEMSTDSRTRQEMLSCYQILSKWSDK